MRDYKKIKAYQLADELCFSIYQMTKDFPKEELYGVISQLRRAAVSVPTNIAEGASRQTMKDYLHFLYIARGSLSELQYLVSLSVRLKYISLEKEKDIVVASDSAAKTLYGLISSVASEVN